MTIWISFTAFVGCFAAQGAVAPSNSRISSGGCSLSDRPAPWWAAAPQTFCTSGAAAPFTNLLRTLPTYIGVLLYRDLLISSPKGVVPPYRDSLIYSIPISL